MQVYIHKTLGLSLGRELLKSYGLDIDRYRHEEKQSIDLTRYSRAKCLDLKLAIEEHGTFKGAKIAADTIVTWLQALKDIGGAKCKDSRESVL
jgi:hypothetical protein